MLASIGLVVLGLILVIAAADRLVVSAVRISRSLGVSTILIGAVVVGLGTSIPELVVSAIAAGDGELDVAMANVVGSNVANVTLVLGAAALLSPVVAAGRTLRREGVLMLVALGVLAAVLLDDRVSREEGLVLLSGLIVALTLLVIWSIGADESEEETDTGTPDRRWGREMLIGVGAIVVTVAGANVLLQGALDIGDRLEWSSTFLGLLLGVATSLPEVATAVAASRRRESGLVIGNVVGSNIFNSLAVAGVAGVIGPAALVDLDVLPVVLMLVTALVAGVFARTGLRIVRREGLALVAIFVVFSLIAF